MHSNEVRAIARLTKRLVAFLAAAAVAGGGLAFYAFHEHRATHRALEQRDQLASTLKQTRVEIDGLAAKVNALSARSAPEPAPAADATTMRKPTVARHPADNSSLKKMQAQLDAQGKAIAETRNDLESTRTDLTNTRTELTGSIARTHEELVVLQKKGERNYYEFDIEKSKQFQHDGPLGIRLRKANMKHQYADLDLLLEDNYLSQKHVNLYQPVMFYTPDSPQPSELVINSVGRNHIHGYVSAPKYRQSELASETYANVPAGGVNQEPTPNFTRQAPQRQKLPSPQ